uniref:Zinc finger protein 516 n=1 Tax=Rhinopithecus bieti TaxID=61621 RepID=A0A2K6JY59_RHIBE
SQQRWPEMEPGRAPAPLGPGRGHGEVDGQTRPTSTLAASVARASPSDSLSRNYGKPTGEKPYKCPYCDHRASQKGQPEDSHRSTAGRDARLGAGLTLRQPTKSCLGSCSEQQGGGPVPPSQEAEGPWSCTCCTKRHKGPFKCRLDSLRDAAWEESAAEPHREGPHHRAGGFFFFLRFVLLLSRVFVPLFFCLQPILLLLKAQHEKTPRLLRPRVQGAWFLKNHMKGATPRRAARTGQSELTPIAPSTTSGPGGAVIVAGWPLRRSAPSREPGLQTWTALNAHNAIHRRVEAVRNAPLRGETGRRGPGTPSKFSLQLPEPEAIAAARRGASAHRRTSELPTRPAQLATRARWAEPDRVPQYWGLGRGRLAGDVGFDTDRRELRPGLSIEKASAEQDAHGCAGPPARAAAPPRSPARATTGQGKSSDASECRQDLPRPIIRIVLPTRAVNRRAPPRQGPVTGTRWRRGPRCGSLSEGDSASQPSSPGSACAAADSPGSGLADEAAEDSGEEGAPEPVPGGQPRRCCFSEEVTSTELSNGDQSHKLGDNASERDTGESKVGTAASVSILENSSRETSRRQEQHRFSTDLKMPAFHPKQEVPGPGDGVEFPSSTGAEGQTGHPAEKLSDLHNKEHSGGGKRALASDLVPLDLSARSTRDDPSNKETASSLQAALVVHPCPYCSHKTYYPEVLWMHKRIWHRISCNSVAPPWIQPNGYKSIRSNLVFLSRSGRTGPPPALGGKECQPLLLARFTRTQVPGGVPGPKSGSSPLGVVTKAASMPKNKESHSGGPCALWAPGPDGHRQTKPCHGQEPHGVAAQGPPAKPRQEASSKPVRSATPTPTVITRAGAQPSANSKPVEKFGVPPAGAGFAPTSKHSAPDSLKAKFSPQPQGPPPAKGEGGAPPLPPREPPSKAAQELRTLATCAAGSRGDAALQAQPGVAGAPPILHSIKQEPVAEGHEKRLDILNIFKTYIPKDLATLYQGWGVSGPGLEHRGTLRTQARPGEFVCIECGKSFHQPGHLRAHMRAHSVVFESDGPRGSEVHTTSADAPKQGRDHSNTGTVQTVPLRKGT